MLRRRLATFLFLLAGAWALVFVVAAAVGGLGHYPGFSLTTSKALRAVPLLLFTGWFVLTPADRELVAQRAALHRTRLLAAGVGFAVLWGLAYKLTHWLALRNSALDLSLFESTLLNTLDGRFMYAWGLNRSLFSEHFEPVVLLFLPLYAATKSSLALQLPQALAVTLAVLPLYRLSRAAGCPSHLAVFVAAAYLLNANVHRSNTLDFHPELFAPLAVFWALHASLERKWVSLYAAVAFAFLLKEELALTMLCCSVLVLRGEGGRRWPHALAVAALSVGWAVLTFKVLMPAAHPAGAELHPLASRWSHLGATYPQMALGLLIHPVYVLGLFAQRAPLELLLSLGAVPLLDPLSLIIAAVPLLPHLSGDYAFAARLGAYYGLFGNLFLIAALPFALRRLPPRAALIAAMITVAAAPTLPFMAPVTAADLHAATRIDAIPARAVVCAQSPLAPHRAPTAALRLLPDCGDAPDWVLLATDHDPVPLDGPGLAAQVASWRARDDYAVRFAEGDYVFLERLTSSP